MLKPLYFITKYAPKLYDQQNMMNSGKKNKQNIYDEYYIHGMPYKS